MSWYLSVDIIYAAMYLRRLYVNVAICCQTFNVATVSLSVTACVSTVFAILLYVTVLILSWRKLLKILFSLNCSNHKTDGPKNLWSYNLIVLYKFVYYFLVVLLHNIALPLCHSSFIVCHLCVCGNGGSLFLIDINLQLCSLSTWQNKDDSGSLCVWCVALQN